MAVSIPPTLDNTARPPADATAAPTGPVAGDGRFLVVCEGYGGATEDVLVGDFDALDEALSVAGAALDVLEDEGRSGVAVVVLDRDGGEWRPVLQTAEMTSLRSGWYLTYPAPQKGGAQTRWSGAGSDFNRGRWAPAYRFVSAGLLAASGLLM